MDRVIEILGDGPAAPGVAREDTVIPHLSRSALDMELQLSLVLVHRDILPFYRQKPPSAGFMCFLYDTIPASRDGIISHVLRSRPQGGSKTAEIKAY